jgi:hypothetical protein
MACIAVDRDAALPERVELPLDVLAIVDDGLSSTPTIPWRL